MLLEMLTDVAAETPPPTGFGEALTAALDVMAFTHDLDLSCTNPGYLPPPSHNEGNTGTLALRMNLFCFILTKN